jgi:hypothetical protein
VCYGESVKTKNKKLSLGEIGEKLHQAYIRLIRQAVRKEKTASVHISD